MSYSLSKLSTLKRIIFKSHQTTKKNIKNRVAIALNNRDKLQNLVFENTQLEHFLL